jgi:hypothetical protein
MAMPLSGMGQALLHAPQLAGSLPVSTQLPAQLVSAPQPLPHTPALHTSPAAQALLHAPQFCGSEPVLTQASPQIVWLASEQTAEHLPSMHPATAPAGAAQAFSQVPQ